MYNYNSQCDYAIRLLSELRKAGFCEKVFNSSGADVCIAAGVCD